jgi:hypothetical protein
MAKSNRSPATVWSPDRYLCQLELQSLVSWMCPPRHCRPDPRVCRLIIHSRLVFETEQIDGNTFWLYLPTPARARLRAGCLILTVD